MALVAEPRISGDSSGAIKPEISKVSRLVQP